MIPKILHLCWFGKNEYPSLVKNCIDTWTEKLPDYKIMVWNEDTFDIESIRWTSEAYSLKKWAFVVDYVRLYALQKYGGVYLDTDVEVIKNFGNLLENESFACSFIEGCLVSMGFIASEPNSKFLNHLLAYYENNCFINEDGTLNNSMNTLLYTKICIDKYGLRFGANEYNNDGMHIYPYDYFMPYRKNLFGKDTFKKKKYIIRDCTYTIHHDLGSWEKDHFVSKMVRGLIRLIIPCRFFLFLKKKKYKKDLKKLVY